MNTNLIIGIVAILVLFIIYRLYKAEKKVNHLNTPTGDIDNSPDPIDGPPVRPNRKPKN